MLNVEEKTMFAYKALHRTLKKSNQKVNVKSNVLKSKNI